MHRPPSHLDVSLHSIHIFFMLPICAIHTHCSQFIGTFYCILSGKAHHHKKWNINVSLENIAELENCNARCSKLSCTRQQSDKHEHWHMNVICKCFSSSSWLHRVICSKHYVEQSCRLKMKFSYWEYSLIQLFFASLLSLSNEIPIMHKFIMKAQRNKLVKNS